MASIHKMIGFVPRAGGSRALALIAGAMLLSACSGEKNTFAGIEFVPIPPGSFMMGSPASEMHQVEATEGPQHKVTLTQGFWLGKFEVTMEEWSRVMGTEPWIESWKGLESLSTDPRVAAVRVNWEDAQSFIEKLNGLGEGTFRLPTEAEWEYACRAGSTTRFYYGDDPEYEHLSKYAWFDDRSEGYVERRRVRQVGQKRPNAWGLYDMHGNASEWCQDWFGEYTNASVTDPKGPQSGSFRVIRGGSWRTMRAHCRSASRARGMPDDSRDSLRTNLGFRLYRSID